MRIALHQMTSGIDPERNVLAMVNAITRSAEAGAAMYFAPEMSIMIDRDRVRARPAAPTAGRTFFRMPQRALQRIQPIRFKFFA